MQIYIYIQPIIGRFLSAKTKYNYCDNNAQTIAELDNCLFPAIPHCTCPAVLDLANDDIASNDEGAGVKNSRLVVGWISVNLELGSSEVH